ncbi:MAG: ATP-dependent DNA ligase [Candidatus Lokiarchaeota archaeon]|nr:ATP-dependent DNA ligase [Candidatus Lokiarchaeota archaeon]
MDYSDLAELYEKLAGTTKRLEMIDILVAFFQKTPSNIIDKVIYLTQGKLFPEWTDNPELGIAEKTALKAISIAYGISESKLSLKMKEYYHNKTIEDLGGLVSKIKSKKQKTLFDSVSLSIEEIYNTLVKITKESGTGANKRKIDLLAGILVNLDPKIAKWIIKTVEGKLRIGIADKTMIDALTIAYTGNKENKEIIEDAYNKLPDLGHIAKILASEGFEGIKKIRIELGKPIKSMLASRVKTPEEILEKMGGKCAIEYKYDGMRIQAHYNKGIIHLFSRNLEDISSQFPDIIGYLDAIEADQFIIDGECVGINQETGKLKPFQDLMHRRRKFEIEKTVEKYVVNFFVFDILYLNGKDLTNTPFLDRKNILKSLIKENNIKLAEYKIVDNVEDFEEFFEESLKKGSEGLIAKSIDSTSIYQAGSRGYIWIKFKESYKEKIGDTIDLIVVAANLGKGKRAGVYGAVFGAVYNEQNGEYAMACKISSGFSDESLEEIMKILEPLKISDKDPLVVPPNNVKPDQWFIPKIVIEVKGDEITLSPTYNAAVNRIKENVGLSVRFPRYISVREDKKPEDATTVSELIQMYQDQEKSS